MNQENLQKAIALRHELHTHPELSNHETWTKARLMDFLRQNTSRLEIIDKGSWFYAAYRAGGDCKGVAFPKDDKGDMRVLTQEEQQRFIAALDGEYYKVMLLTYLYTGMRMGECIPLQWKDIDLSKRTIRVNKKAIVRHDYATHSAKQEVQDFCKTKSSKRTVAITAGLTAILSEYKESMRQRAENMGQAWSEESLVFLNTRDKMVYSRNLQESLYKIYRKAGIEGATMHTLRHTYATRCFEAGVDIKAISEQLGHANVKTTYNIYVHLLDDTRAKEIDKLSGIDKFIASEATTGNAVIIPFPEREKAV